MSPLSAARAIPNAGRNAYVHRRWKRVSRGEQAPPAREIARPYIERVHVEVRVTIQRSSWHPTLLPLEASPAPTLVVHDTRQLIASLGGGHPPPFAPVAFRVNPSRALLNALLDFSLDAVMPTATPRLAPSDVGTG